MAAPIMIAYSCPKCRADQAILLSNSKPVSIVKCADCGRKHGRLDEIREALYNQARDEGAQKARQIYRTRPQRGSLSSTRRRRKSTGTVG